MDQQRITVGVVDERTALRTTAGCWCIGGGELPGVVV